VYIKEKLHQAEISPLQSDYAEPSTFADTSSLDHVK